MACPGRPNLSNSFLLEKYSDRYARRVRTELRYRAIPPMVGAYDRPLSFTMITSRRELSSVMLFSASQVIPPVRAPSPTTATT